MQVIKEDGCPIKLWVDNIEDIEPGALGQLKQLSKMPFIYPHIAVMPDCHIGVGACIGTVIPTTDAIIPSCVGVDLGCGMVAIQTDRLYDEFLEDLKAPSTHKDEVNNSLNIVRRGIEARIPHGRSENGGSGDIGGWQGKFPNKVKEVWEENLKDGFEFISKNITNLNNTNSINHLGTLGTGNHFIELSKDEHGYLWVMVHSGSRGVGNRLGVVSIRKAKELMAKYYIKLENPDLAYFPRDCDDFNDYMFIVEWCQKFAKFNRILMVESVLNQLGFYSPEIGELNRISCHHNYVRQENHCGKNVFVTRKGAIRAGGRFQTTSDTNLDEWSGDWGIIPGSMNSKSYIVRGKGNKDSFHSASHGAGRAMSRTQAREQFTGLDVVSQTEGVECKKDISIVDEIPGSYKNIDTVMKLQSDLVSIEHTLTPVLCVKG